MRRIKEETGNMRLLICTLVVLTALAFTGNSIQCSAGNSADLQSGGAEDQELSAYLGQPLSMLDTYFSDLSEAVWAMGITSRANDLVTFQSSNEESVTEILLHPVKAPYSLCGVRTDMSVDDAEKELEEQGFSYMQTAAHKDYDALVYYDGGRNFVSVWEDGNGYLNVGLETVGWGPHTDRQEAAFYMGKPMEQVIADIHGLSVQTDGEMISLQTDGIAFSGTGDNLSDACVSRIDIFGTDCDYCLYGIVPGDSWESVNSLGFEEGGSGECFDPVGNLFVFYYSMATGDDGEPRLYLTSE